MKKKIVFIGNRTQVLDVCLAEPDWEVEAGFAVRGSLLEADLTARALAHTAFAFADKEVLSCNSWRPWTSDILVSNGCPFISPSPG